MINDIIELRVNKDFSCLFVNNVEKKVFPKTDYGRLLSALLFAEKQINKIIRQPPDYILVNKEVYDILANDTAST